MDMIPIGEERRKRNPDSEVPCRHCGFTEESHKIGWEERARRNGDEPDLFRKEYSEFVNCPGFLPVSKGN